MSKLSQNPTYSTTFCGTKKKTTLLYLAISSEDHNTLSSFAQVDTRFAQDVPIRYA